MASVISGDANVSATEFGFLDGVTSSLQSQIDAKLPLAGGKILQVVRATDSTNRSTTSGSMVDASISVTITPQKNDSAILVIWSAQFRHASGDYVFFQITDSSNNAISGAQQARVGTETALTNTNWSTTIIGYSTPATTSATTYKGRFSNSGTANTALIANTNQTGQLFAIEVSS